MRLVVVLLAAILLAQPLPAEAETRVISRDQLEEMFQGIKDGTSWDLSRPLLWGYFFTDASSERLRAAAALLEKEGYRFVDIYPADDDSSSNRPDWWLHVERVEHHTVDSLHQRNTELEAFASSNGLDAYDGMDVGPAPGAQ